MKNSKLYLIVSKLRKVYPTVHEDTGEPQNIFRRRTFVLVVSIVMLPLLIMSFLSAKLYIDRENNRIETDLNVYSQTLSTNFENVFASIRSYYLSLAVRDSFRWLASQTYPPYQSIKEVSEIQYQLQGDYHINAYIEDYTFINIQNGWILNNYGIFKINEIQNQADLKTLYEAIKQSYVSLSWINLEESLSENIKEENKSAQEASDDLEYRPNSVIRTSRYLDLSGQQLLLKASGYTDLPKYVLLVKLKDSSFKNLMQAYSDVYKVEILNQDGGTFVGNTSEISQYLHNHSSLNGYGEEFPQYFRSQQGILYQSISKQDTSSGYKYYLAFDLSNTWKNYVYFVLFAIGIGVLSLGIIYFLNLLFKRYTIFVINLKHKVDEQQLSMKKLFIERIISGKADEAYISKQLNMLGLTGDTVFRLSAFVPKYMLQDKREYQLTAEEMTEFLADIMPPFAFSPVVYHDQMLVLTHGTNRQKMDEDTIKLYNAIREESMSKWGCRLAVGISRIYDDINDTNSALKEAQEALILQKQEGNTYGQSTDSMMVLFDDYIQQGKDRSFAYDQVIENELKNTIAHGSYEEVSSYIELIIERLQQRELKGRDREFYLMRIIMAILEVPQNLGISLNDIFSGNNSNILQRVLQLYDYHKIEKFLKEELLLPIMGEVSENKYKGDSDLVKSIIELINSSGGEMTLNECAATLHYHSSYLWKVLKSEKGVTFTDLTNQIKVDRAKQFLLTTDMSVSEISERLNYNSVQNFIRFFSKMEGITPAKFRKKHIK